MLGSQNKAIPVAREKIIIWAIIASLYFACTRRPFLGRKVRNTASSTYVVILCAPQAGEAIRKRNARDPSPAPASIMKSMKQIQPIAMYVEKVRDWA
jgi:hypothetical protein